jgi:outer membrane cobalamin receptor
MWARSASEENFYVVSDDFETETSWTYEIGGMKTLTQDMKFRSAIYYNDISDYQQMTYNDNATYPVYNIDVAVYGVELELTRSFARDLSGYISYVWQNYSVGHNPLAGSETNYLMQNLPRNKVNLGLNYKLWEGGVVTLNSQYMGERTSERGKDIADFITVNVGAQHTFELTHCDFTLKAFVNNGTDEEYEMRYGYPMPGINAGISGKVSF